ncbi:MAG: helix-turn-helix transcriptional regulator [Spirochaetales bacterium]|nr:helix-turn-helix transcriptional regulator [Spirochaetales bacterium]
MKNRHHTEQDIIAAVDTLARRKGIQKLGINAVARQAGVSKVLIYRYFGGFEELLAAWALKNSYWAGHLPPPETGPRNLSDGIDILKGQITTMRSTPLLREIERWLLLENSTVGSTIMARLEERGTALTRAFSSLLKPGKNDTSIDTEALIALLTAGVAYLSMKSDRCNVYNGVPLDNEEGWNRISRTLENIIQKVLD